MFQEKDSQIVISEVCKCQFHSDTSAYYGTILIQNNSQKTMYYNITSTFSHYLKVLYNPKQLQPTSTLQIKFKITPTNQISNTKQKIFISTSSSKIQTLCFSLDGTKHEISLKFGESFVQDEQINSILEIDSKQIEDNARKSYNEGNFKKAKNLYEEAFILFRQNLSPILGLINCHFMLKQMNEALSKVELFLCVNPENLETVLLKANILEELGNQESGINKLVLVKEGIKLIKKIETQGKNIKKGLLLKGQKILSRLQKIKQQLSAIENQSNFQSLIIKAVDNFSSNEDLSQAFANKESFEYYLRDVLKNEEKQAQQTPQYCLDPINYEIYQDPYIVPCGNSYEKAFLMKYFKIHGDKDPFTRTYLNPKLVYPNISLKVLVRNNPSLHKWLKYEKETSKF